MNSVPSGLGSIPSDSDWSIKKEYLTAEDGRVSIYTRADDPGAEMITLNTASGRRIVVQRTKTESILMSSDRGGKTTRYLRVSKA